MKMILEKIISASPHLAWVKDRTIFLGLHGSRAYGTNTETSDYDYKGICIPTKEYYFGCQHHFEQAELKDPDTVIYEIRKFFDLAINCNPNIIELLHIDPADYILVSPLGEKILDHRQEFLSKKAKYTFTGYAVAQLKRMKLHRRYLLNPPTVLPTRKGLGLPEETLIPQDQLAAATAEIQKELDRFSFDFMQDLSEDGKIGIRAIVSEMLAELKITTTDHWMAAARQVGLSDNFIEIMKKERTYTTAKREWDQYHNWKKMRNPARAALEEKFGFDAKHAYHLVRLVRMCKEILTTGQVIVKRPDREELLFIRNGGWSFEKILEFAETEEKELTKIYETCNVLPKSPNREKLDKLCIELIETSLRY